MTNDETTIVLQFISEAWHGKPISRNFARIMGTELITYQFADIMRVLRELHKTREYRPSLASIIKPFRPEVEQASLAFPRVLKALDKSGQVERDAFVGKRAAETVRRLGGWGVVGIWDNAMRHHQMRDFERVWKDVIVGEHDETLRAIASPVLKSLTRGAK